MTNSLDTLSWIRICWDWIHNPGPQWKRPEILLSKLPRAVTITDCKSLCDVTTKNTEPKCEEQRTALECLLIKERLGEGTDMRWIATDAMLADPLTKGMDAKLLRDVLRIGQYSLYDERLTLARKRHNREKINKLA